MNNDNLSDEEIERRLKIVQLKREELGLAKEMARIERLKNVDTLFSRISFLLENVKNFLMFIFGKLFLFIRNNLWKIILTPLILVCSFLVIDYSERIRIEKYIDQRDEYIEECGEVSFRDRYTNPDLANKIFDCRDERSKLFKKKYKPFLIINDDYHL